MENLEQDFMKLKVVYFFGTDPIQEFQDFFLILQFCQVFGILAIVLMPKGLM